MTAPLIVITGATHGMGRALAIAFAREYCKMLGNPGFHRARAHRRDHPVLLQAAAVDLHPRPGGDADHLGILSAERRVG